MTYWILLPLILGTFLTIKWFAKRSRAKRDAAYAARLDAWEHNIYVGHENPNILWQWILDKYNKVCTRVEIVSRK